MERAQQDRVGGAREGGEVVVEGVAVGERLLDVAEVDRGELQVVVGGGAGDRGHGLAAAEVAEHGVYGVVAPQGVHAGVEIRVGEPGVWAGGDAAKVAGDRGPRCREGLVGRGTKGEEGGGRGGGGDARAEHAVEGDDLRVVVEQVGALAVGEGHERVTGVAADAEEAAAAVCEGRGEQVVAGLVADEKAGGRGGQGLIDERGLAGAGEQQRCPVRVFRVPPEQDTVAAIDWRDEVLRAESVPEHERPRYLLILGDFMQVSLALQQILVHGCFVGRLAFTDEAAYSAYADKVLTWERTSRALYYTAQDGTSAISAGYRNLMQPCAEMTERWRIAGKLELAEPAITLAYADEGPGSLIAAAGAREASVLLSLSYGLGAPRRGWKSLEQQRRTQGALCLGLDGDPLSAETLGSAAFLPGGVWLMVACFGVGTPADSAYLPWLQALAERGGEGKLAGEVLRSLPRGINCSARRIRGQGVSRGHPQGGVDVDAQERSAGIFIVGRSGGASAVDAGAGAGRGARDAECDD